nr:hypothetical protein CFP56_29530 [Quercus suber]
MFSIFSIPTKQSSSFAQFLITFTTQTTKYEVLSSGSLCQLPFQILKLSTQRKFGTLTNSKTHNFTEPRPYFKSSKKNHTHFFFSQRKKPYSLNPKENADQPQLSPPNC